VRESQGVRTERTVGGVTRIAVSAWALSHTPRAGCREFLSHRSAIAERSSAESKRERGVRRRRSRAGGAERRLTCGTLPLVKL
jgi:hypothetical protein